MQRSHFKRHQIRPLIQKNILQEKQFAQTLNKALACRNEHREHLKKIKLDETLQQGQVSLCLHVLVFKPPPVNKLKQRSNMPVQK